MTTSGSKYEGLVFDPRTLRLIVGAVALFLPIVTPLRSSTPLTSISASYYTESRDVFVGSLFIIGALLLAYNGRPHPLKEQAGRKLRQWIRKTLSIKDVSREERVVSFLGALAALGTALSPTSCNGCPGTLVSVIHYICAVILFLTIAYFCLFVFRDSANEKRKEKEIEKEEATKQIRRTRWYLGCGTGIIACLLVAGIAQLILSAETRSTLAITFWMETASLWLFAASWMVASQIFPYFADPDERLRLLEETARKKVQKVQMGA